MIHGSYFFNICLMSGGIFLHFHKLFPNLDISRSRYLTSKQLYEAMKFMCEVLQWLDRTAKKILHWKSPLHRTAWKVSVTNFFVVSFVLRQHKWGREGRNYFPQRKYYFLHMHVKITDFTCSHLLVFVAARCLSPLLYYAYTCSVPPYSLYGAFSNKNLHLLF